MPRRDHHVPRCAAVVALSLAAFAAGGCGSTNSASTATPAPASTPSAAASTTPSASTPASSPVALTRAPRAALVAYVAASARGDVKAVCAGITGRMQAVALHDAQLMKSNSGKLKGFPTTPPTDCPTAAAWILSQEQGSWDKVRAYANTAAITVTGHNAVAKTTQSTTYLTLVDGKWLVDQPSGGN
jgi:hypothetical protein